MAICYRGCGECYTAPNVQIVRQPEDVNGEVGDNLTLSVIASTDSVYRIFYQWYRNGVEIPGAIRNIYDVPNEIMDDEFYVVVRDGLVNITSGTVRVIVTPAIDDFKVKMIYIDSTPDFIVPLDGSDTVTQADGDLAIGNYDVNKVKLVIVGNQMRHLGSRCFFGAGALDGWISFNGEILLRNGLKTVGSESFARWNHFDHDFTLPNTVEDISMFSFVDWFKFSGVFTLSNNISALDFLSFMNMRSINSEFIIPPSVKLMDHCLTQWELMNTPFIVPETVEEITDFSFISWYSYDKDFTFMHKTPPILGNGIFHDWKDYFPARIVTPNSTVSNLEWKNALSDSYAGGDIESINGILWDDIV